MLWIEAGQTRETHGRRRKPATGTTPGGDHGLETRKVFGRASSRSSVTRWEVPIASRCLEYSTSIRDRLCFVCVSQNVSLGSLQIFKVHMNSEVAPRNFAKLPTFLVDFHEISLVRSIGRIA